jgi:hypothetical protein
LQAALSGRFRARRADVAGERPKGAVSQQRVHFHEAMRERFVAVVENATGRRVIGFMAGSHQEPDMMCEVLLLAPTDLLDDAHPGV